LDFANFRLAGPGTGQGWRGGARLPQGAARPVRDQRGSAGETAALARITS